MNSTSSKLTPPQDFLQCLHLCPALRTINVRDTDVLRGLNVLQAMGKWGVAKNRFRLIPHLKRLSLPSYEIAKWDSGDVSLLIEKFLKKRLCPPTGPSSRAFTTLWLPFRMTRPNDWVRSLETLSNSPWRLKVIPSERSAITQTLWSVP